MNDTHISKIRRSRPVEQLLIGQTTSDGAGVKLTRVITQSLQHRLDPFLMLDAFGSDRPDDYIAGFPNHPHRGFETLTYLIAGRMRHSDNAGHSGILETGGIQWMTAGRGIVHSEMPEQQDGMLEGFQLWINLPAATKMQAPNYRDVQSQGIPEITLDGSSKVRVVVGACSGVTGAIQRPTTEPMFLDLQLTANAEFHQPLESGFNAFLYVYRGEMTIGGRRIPEKRLAILGNDNDADGVIINTDRPSRAILVAGRALREPIVQHGPFVMNSDEEIHQAMLDYQAGKF